MQSTLRTSDSQNFINNFIAVYNEYSESMSFLFKQLSYCLYNGITCSSCRSYSLFFIYFTFVKIVYKKNVLHSKCVLGVGYIINGLLK